MTFNCRQYETADDYWRVREFFRELHTVDPRSRANWHVCDFDYWRWHYMENVWERPLHELRYWQLLDGRITAVLIQGEPGVCHPMADPNAVTRDLLHEMLETAESTFTIQLADGRQGSCAWAGRDDDLLSSALEARGFELPPEGRGIDYYGWQPLPEAPTTAKVPEGYILRSMGDSDDHPARSLASWRAFHPGEADEGADPDGAWYRHVKRAPTYRRDLDVVAVEEESGDIVSFSTGYFDDVSRAGVIVLVGTATLHQRKGLGRAVVTETLRRLHWLGAVGARVTWTDPEAGALYESCGFTDQRIGKAWRKFF